MEANIILTALNLILFVIQIVAFSNMCSKISTLNINEKKALEQYYKYREAEREEREVLGVRRRKNGEHMKTEILKVKGDWQEVVDDCRATVGKYALGKEPSEQFKRGILIAEHSPIRDIIVKWRWKDMPHWVTVHWVRHKWECYAGG